MNEPTVTPFIRVVRLIFGVIIGLCPVAAAGIIIIFLHVGVDHWMKLPIEIVLAGLAIWLGVLIFRTIWKIGWIGLYAAQYHTPEFEEKDKKEN